MAAAVPRRARPGGPRRSTFQPNSASRNGTLNQPLPRFFVLEQHSRTTTTPLVPLRLSSTKPLDQSLLSFAPPPGAPSPRVLARWPLAALVPARRLGRWLAVSTCFGAFRPSPSPEPRQSRAIPPARTAAGGGARPGARGGRAPSGGAASCAPASRPRLAGALDECCGADKMTS